MIPVRIFLLAVLATACSTAQEPAQPYSPVISSNERAMETVTFLSSDDMQGRDAGSEGNAKARAYIEQQFKALGLTPIEDTFAYPFARSSFRNKDDIIHGVNIVGMMQGQDDTSDLVMVVSAHYDHVGVRDGEIYNGADDNASGVAALLEVAHYFKKHTPQHDVLFVAFDAEEKGLVGSAVFVSEPPIEKSRIAFNFNLDMVSRVDNGIFWAVGTYHFPFLKPYIEEAAVGAPLHLKTGFDEPGDRSTDWSYASDQGPFIRDGIPAILLSVEDHEDYHKPTDDVSRINPETYAKAIEIILNLAQIFDQNLSSIHQAAADTQ